MGKKHLSVFSKNTIFYEFLTKFSRSNENGTFLWFYKLFLFCPFDEDKWGCTCQISHYFDALVLRYTSLKMRSEFCSHPVTLCHAVWCLILYDTVWYLRVQSEVWSERAWNSAHTFKISRVSHQAFSRYEYFCENFPKKCEQNSDRFLEKKNKKW